MIIYKSSDIIKRAMQLADLENSDFISFSEKISALNEAYQQLYQKSINKNDNTFVKSIHTCKTRITLPKDFYQLKTINVYNSDYVEPVLRRPTNQSTNILSYDIVNNTLTINGYCSGDICIEYYPTPKTLTLPNKTKSFTPFITNSKILALRNNIYVAVDSNNNITVGDATNSEISYEITEDEPVLYKNYIHIEDDYVTFTDGVTQTLYSLADNKTITTDKIVVIYKRSTYLFDEENNSLIFPTGETAYTDINVGFVNATINILSNDKQSFIGLIYSEEPNVVVGNTEEIIIKKEIGNITKMFANEDIIYLINGTKKLQAINLNNLNNIYSSIKENNILDIQCLDDNTGYGYLTNSFGGKYNIVSFFEDTVLNFPLNTYFVFMSYILAILFKNKQGADISQLSALYSTAEEQFYDSLSRDDWCTTRITNIY